MESTLSAVYSGHAELPLGAELHGNNPSGFTCRDAEMDAGILPVPLRLEGPMEKLGLDSNQI